MKNKEVTEQLRHARDSHGEGKENLQLRSKTNIKVSVLTQLYNQKSVEESTANKFTR